MSTSALHSSPVLARSQPPVRVAVRKAPVRLTRRGRLLLTLLLTLVLAGALGSVRLKGHASATTDGPVASFVTVSSGQTLWQIAGAVAPGQDRRATVARIIELNDLRSARIAAGQQLAVPIR